MKAFSDLTPLSLKCAHISTQGLVKVRETLQLYWRSSFTFWGIPLFAFFQALDEKIEATFHVCPASELIIKHHQVMAVWKLDVLHRPSLKETSLLSEF